MAVIGSSVLSAVIGKVVNLGFKYMVDQYEQQTCKEDELLKLKRLLPRIQAVVEAAGKGHLKIEGSLKDWWWQLKDALDAAEDVVDDFEYLRLEEQVLQQNYAGEENQPHKVRKVLSTLSRSKENMVKIGKRAIQQDPILKSLRDAVKMLHEVCNGLDAFVGLLSNVQQWQHQKHVQFMSNRETGSLLTENKVIGREKERNNILEWLQMAVSTEYGNNYENVSLLSIVGHGGMGKTTLAQLVFNDEAVQKSFALKIWVCVSTSFDVKGLTRQILQSINKQKSQIDRLAGGLANLQNDLKENLMSSGKFLLVLDDVWNDKNISSWGKLFVPFKEAPKGSKILLTTRMDQVADMAARAIGGSKKSTKLEGLQDDDYFHLFNQYAFAGVSSADYRELQSIGSQIARRLWGSPLVAKTVGGMLNSNLDAGHWNNILHSDIFKLEEDEEGILSVLRLTYHNLPEHLRPCFAYCGIFPQGHEFDKDDLIRMWIATGLIQQSQNQRESLEDVGCRYFDDLLRRSFFEHKMSIFPIKYIMHDLLHDLARVVSDGECFISVGDMPVEAIPDTARHLFLQTNVPDVLEKTVMRCKNLRTLLLFFDGFDPGHSWAINNMLKSLKSMRVMHLSVDGMEVLPDGIGDSKHLRYLKLHPTVQELPTTLCRLYHLQVIVREEPFIFRQPPFALPTNVNNLICLRHLMHLWCTHMIAGIGKLTSLQELGFTIMKEDGHKIGELRDLRELRELRIEGLENVRSSDEAREAELLNKKHLRHLYLSWDLNDRSGRNRRTELDEQVLDCLQPNSVLKELYIEGYGSVKSANWMQPTLINNLELIYLECCPRWEKLPHLSKLPFLKHLSLYHFPALELWDEQPESGAEAGTWFPCLQYLRLVNCPILNVLPSLPLSLKTLELNNVGLASVPALQLSSSCSAMGSSSSSSLSELNISNCRKLVSLADGLLGHHSAHRLTALKRLCIYDCEELLHLPLESFRYLCSLKILELDKCPKLQASDITNLEENFLPSSLQQPESGAATGTWFPCLQDLRLVNCPILNVLPSLPLNLKTLVLNNVGLASLPALQHSSSCSTMCSSSSSSLSELKISNCPKLVSLADGLLGHHSAHRLTALERLCIADCEELLHLPLKSFRYLCSLKILKLDNCPKLQPSDITNLEENFLPSSLQELCISQCFGLENSLPLLLQGLNSLSILELKRSSITSLPSAEVLRRLTSLTDLFIEECNELTSLGGLHALAHLYRLDIHRCPNLLQAETSIREKNNPGQEEGFRSTVDNVFIDNPLLLLTVPLRSPTSVQASDITNLEENFLPSSLQSLHISQCSGLENSPPLLLQGLNSLSILRLGCSSITSLPSAEVFRRLTSLTELFIKDCSELTSLGGLQALPHLNRLAIYGCPNLLQAETLTREENNPGQEEDFRLTVDSLFIDNPLLLLTVPLRSLSSVQSLVVFPEYQLMSLPCEVDHWLSQNHPQIVIGTKHRICLSDVKKENI